MASAVTRKRCSRCRHAKPLDEFPHGGGSHGRHAYCHPCLRDYDAERKARPDARARDVVRQRAYTRASAVLRERHQEEFREIYEQAWRYEAARADLP